MVPTFLEVVEKDFSGVFPPMVFWVVPIHSRILEKVSAVITRFLQRRDGRSKLYTDVLKQVARDSVSGSTGLYFLYEDVLEVPEKSLSASQSLTFWKVYGSMTGFHVVLEMFCKSFRDVQGS